MTDSLERLRHKIDRARQLGSVVHAMKALATLSIGQYESAVRSLEEYLHTVELGLSVCLRMQPLVSDRGRASPGIAAIAFGSDQGLVGRFNDAVVERVQRELAPVARPDRFWVVGDRLAARFADSGVTVDRVLAVPSSTGTIAALVACVLMGLEEYQAAHPGQAVLVFFNGLVGGSSYETSCERLLPLDAQWQQRFVQLAWPTENLPQPVGDIEATLRAHAREYLFASLFRACAESLSSENASRLAAMQRAERNIDSLIDNLTQSFNEQRQSAIDEELFDVIAGFEALANSRVRRAGP